MNRRIIATLLLLVLCNNAYSLIISKGKILNHQAWSDAGVSATISDVNFAQTASTTQAIHHQDLGFSKETNEAIGISNMINAAKGVMNQKTKLKGGVKTYIENFTKVPHVYTVKSMVCADANRRCSYTLDTIELAPGGKIQSRKLIELTHAYKTKGTRLIYIATWVKRDDSSSLVQTDNVNTVNIDIS